MDEIEVDMQGQTALLHIKTPDGLEWVAAAVLSELHPVDHEAPTRRIEPEEELRLMEFKVVVP
jgi:hypothetical protein